MTATLDDQQINELRRLYWETNEKTTELGQRFGIKHTRIPGLVGEYVDERLKCALCGEPLRYRNRSDRAITSRGEWYARQEERPWPTCDDCQRKLRDDTYESAERRNEQWMSRIRDLRDAEHDEWQPDVALAVEYLIRDARRVGLGILIEPGLQSEWVIELVDKKWRAYGWDVDKARAVVARKSGSDLTEVTARARRILVLLEREIEFVEACGDDDDEDDDE